jgi:glycosyltransferase involved in cell wall biosynthesis
VSAVASEAPLFSVVTPTYNRRDYLARCIESVRAQTFPLWEQLIVDDGSTEDIEGLVAGYGDPRLRYLRQDHLGIDGLGQTYNHALVAARGKYIAVLESDDLWPAGKLARQLASLEGTRAVLSYGRAALVGADDRPFATTRSPSPRPTVRANRPIGSALTRLLFHNYIVSSTVVMRRRALEAIGGFLQPPYSRFVDYPTYLALSLQGEFAYLDETLGLWRRHEGSETFAGAGPVLAAGRRCAREFFDAALREGRLPRPIAALDGALRAHESRVEEYARFLDGRRLLLLGRWPEARREFRGLTRAGSTPLRAAAIVGIAGSLLHRDIEPLCRQAGLFAYR